jgi:hypothetical protein
MYAPTAKDELMTEADRIVKRQIASERADRKAESRRRETADAIRRVTLHHEIKDLIAKICLFAKEHNFPGVEPVRLRPYRFPPLGDLFGYRESVKGGWSLGAYGMQSLSLLPDGRILWEGMPSRLSKIEHCVPLIRDGLDALWKHLNTGSSESWKPPSVIIGP